MEYNLLYPMDIMNEKDFIEYIFEKAKPFLGHNISETDNKSSHSICSIHQVSDKDCKICNVEKTSINENITPSAVKELVDQMKKINSSLSFTNSLIDTNLNESEITEKPNTKRYLKVAGYENKNIELGETLKETMSIYNKQKDVTRGTETDETSWKRLVNYNKHKD